jgi:hypothetical protein
LQNGQVGAGHASGQGGVSDDKAKRPGAAANFREAGTPQPPATDNSGRST